MTGRTIKSIFFKSIVLTLAAAVAIGGLSGCTKKAAATENGVKVVKVGTGNAMAPFCYLDENNKPTGYEVDVINEYQKKLPQYKFEIEAMDFSQLAVSLQAGKIQLATHQFIRTEDREKKFLIPKEYYTVSIRKLLVKKDRSDINSLDDLQGKTMAVDPTSADYQELVAYNDKHTEKIKLDAIEGLTGADAMKLVDQGRADAAQAYSSTFNDLQKSLNLNLKQTGITAKDYSIQLINIKETQLADDINNTIKELREDGTLSKLAVKWFGEDVFSE